MEKQINDFIERIKANNSSLRVIILGRSYRVIRAQFNK